MNKKQSPLDKTQLKNEFLANDESNFHIFLRKLKCLHQYVLSKQAFGPKFPIKPFNYNDTLEKASIPQEGRTSEEVFIDFVNILDGSFRPHSKNFFFNIVPTPLFDSTAAATLMALYNNNSIMDEYGGKAILYEQHIARSIGKLAGWDKAYGISCSGGKLTLYYAIKCALLRIDSNSEQKGIEDNVVIFALGGSHYSLEHICNLLGLGTNKCIRIPRGDTDVITIQNLKQVFVQQIEKKNRVACIVCCGGTTLDFVTDQTDLIYDAVSEIHQQYQLDYFPYLHLDSVIGWLWFTFFNMNYDQIQALTKQNKITYKIFTVTSRLKGVKNFDSFGVDMHKTGLCPYSSSFFIARNRSIIDNSGNTEPNYGDIRAFLYTLENSRPTIGIASGWVSLQRLGINGYREYLIKLMICNEKIKQALKRAHNKFIIINENSLGWEVIFTINYPILEMKLTENYDVNIITEFFVQYIWKKIREGKNYPNISIIKNFQSDFKQATRHGFIICNMHVDIDDDYINEIPVIINQIATEFELSFLNREYWLFNSILKEPIR